MWEDYSRNFEWLWFSTVSTCRYPHIHSHCLLVPIPWTCLCLFALSHLGRLFGKSLQTHITSPDFTLLVAEKEHMALPRTSSLDTSLIAPPQRGLSSIRSFCSRPHMKPHDWTHTPFSYLRLSLSSSCMCDFLTSQSLPLNPFGARPEVL